jgi:hypothetical protein
VNQILVFGQLYSDTLTTQQVDLYTVSLLAGVTYNFDVSSAGAKFGFDVAISSAAYPNSFTIGQGAKAIQNSYAARGLDVSGAAIKA